MRVRRVEIQGFRGYLAPTELFTANDQGEDITVLVGRNDAGKSTWLEALELFFDCQGRGGKCRRSDFHVDLWDGEDLQGEVSITVDLDDLPVTIPLDESRETTLADERLEYQPGVLRLKRVWGRADAVAETFVVAPHPLGAGDRPLICLPNAKLKAAYTALEKDGHQLQGANKSVNSELRAALIAHAESGSGSLPTRELPLKWEDGKRIDETIAGLLPTYLLFKADRQGQLSDVEAQGPLQAVVKDTLARLEDRLKEVETEVQQALVATLDGMLEGLRQLDSSVADRFSPVVRDMKWGKAPDIDLVDDRRVSLSARGSGVRRLALMGFLLHKARAENHAGRVIYAVEEPETALHPSRQRLLVDALRSLSSDGLTQVLVTTHHPGVAHRLPLGAIRWIRANDGGPTVASADPDPRAFRDELVDELGRLPDSSIRLFVSCEGPHDREALLALSDVFSDDPSCYDLRAAVEEGHAMFVVGHGDDLPLVVEELANMNVPEFGLCDRDDAPPGEGKPGFLDEEHVPRRLRFPTLRREMENYATLDAIIASIPQADEADREALRAVGCDDLMGDVPSGVSRVLKEKAARGEGQGLKSGTVKAKINKFAFALMSVDDLRGSGSYEEVRLWFVAMSALVEDSNEMQLAARDTFAGLVGEMLAAA